MTKEQYLAAMAKYKTKEDAYNDSLFVKKVSGKGLSTEDYTTAEQTKLAGIDAGAEENVIESITVNNGQALTVTNKSVNIDLSGYALASDISSVYKYKGSVASYSVLPSSGQEVGDVYNVEAADTTNGINAGDNVAWNGTAWDVLAGTVDLTGYVQAEDGKGLSHIDVTQTMKDTWDNIDTNDDVLDSDFDFLFPPPNAE